MNRISQIVLCDLQLKLEDFLKLIKICNFLFCFLLFKPNKTATVELDLDKEATKIKDSEDITNLTAEIESFVRIADTDKEMLENRTNETSREFELPLHQSYGRNDCQTEEITIEKIQNLGEVDENSDKVCKQSPVKILVRAPTDEELVLNNSEEIKTNPEIENNDFAKKITEDNEEKDENGNLEAEIETINETIIDDQTKIIPSVLTEEIVDENNQNTCEDNTCFEANELRITESMDDLTLSVDTKHQNCEIRDESKNASEEYELYPSTSTISPITMRTKERSDINKKEPPTPPLRRRSVKEIIDSINKCQIYLKTGKVSDTSTSSPKTFKNKSFFNDHNMNDTNKKDYQKKRLFTDMTEVNNNDKGAEMCNIPLFVEKFNELNNNNKI